MIQYIIKRLLGMIPVLLGIILIIFIINSFAPGDPVLTILGTEFTQEQYDAVEKELGLDKPVLVRFVDYVVGIVTELDFGISYQNKLPVKDQLLERIPVSIYLGILGMALTVIIGVPFGVISATKQYSVLDYSVTSISLVFASMPSFWLALMLIIFFALDLKWLPASGLESWKAWILPCVAIGLSPVASVSRTTRSSMLEVIRQDYIRTGYAKGLSKRAIIWRHALKNALIPVVTVVGLQLGMIMGGSMVVEVIFSIPGLGSLLLNAINNQNYPMIQGCVLVISLFISVMSLLVDILYAFIDPRIKGQYQKRRKAAVTVREGGSEA